MASISSKNLEVQIANHQQHHHHQRREQRDEAIDSNSTGSFHPRPSVLYSLFSPFYIFLRRLLSFFLVGRPLVLYYTRGRKKGHSLINLCPVTFHRDINIA